MGRLAKLVIVIVASLVLTACRKHSDEPKVTAATTITFVGWGAPEEKAFVQQAINELTRLKPDLHVEYTQVPGVGYDYLNKLRLMIVAGQAPDVFYVPDGAFFELVKSGSLLNLDPMIAANSEVADEIGAMWPTATMRYRFDGQDVHRGSFYALPKDLGPMVLYFNASLLKAKGLSPPDPNEPMTWEEALAMWKALSSPPSIGQQQRYGLTSFPYEAAVWSKGAEILSPDRRSWLMTDPVAIEAVQWCADLALVHHVAPSPTRIGNMQMTELFEAGIAATHIDGRWMVPRYRRTLAFDWDVAPIPVPHRGAPSIARSGSVGFAISAKTHHPREAFELVRWLAGPKGQAILVQSGLQLPNQKAEAMSDAFLQRDQSPAHAEVFLAAAATSRPGPQTQTESPFWFDVYSTFAESFWRGDRKAKDVIVEVAPRINQALRAGSK